VRVDVHVDIYAGTIRLAPGFTSTYPLRRRPFTIERETENRLLLSDDENCTDEPVVKNSAVSSERQSARSADNGFSRIGPRWRSDCAGCDTAIAHGDNQAFAVRYREEQAGSRLDCGHEERRGGAQ
jgi:hypothetical protein